MKKPGITKEALLKLLKEKIPPPLRYRYFEMCVRCVKRKPAITCYEEKRSLRTVAESIARALKRLVEALLRWWRKVREK